jgi:hypothetical protein
VHKKNLQDNTDNTTVLFDNQCMAVAAVAKVVAVDDLKQPATMPQVTVESTTTCLMDRNQLDP